MKKTYIFILLFFAVTYSIRAQEIKVEKYDPPVPYYGTVSWGNDYIVSDSEPLGLPSGVYRQSNSTIYVAIPDTNIIPNRSVVVLSSINNGANWSAVASITPSNVVTKTKMVKTSLDEVYCFFLLGSSVYCWNVLTDNVNLFTLYQNIRDFDVATSSTGSLYLIIDLNTNNQVRFFGSIDGGANWIGAIFLSSAAARPRIYMSAGDTLLINYNGPVAGLVDTTTAAIRNVRYRESSPGTLVIAGTIPTFTTIVPEGIPKNQFQGVLFGGIAWVFYTEETPGNMDLKCLISNDNGTNYGFSFSLQPMPGRDESWFDAKHFALGGGGVDVIYYSDSLQAGPPTNSSDKMYYTNAPVSIPDNFADPEPFSEHPPEWSERGYIPSLIEYYDVTGDVGAIWVGLDGSNKNLYFDRLNKLVNISNQNEIPDGFYLGQNYPNPFNPSTKIEFSVPQKGFVTLKIFDILGKEVTSLINKEMSAGIYSVEFNPGSKNLSSGVYYYKLVSGTFTDTKAMMLLK
jgi:hypothetical protein